MKNILKNTFLSLFCMVLLAACGKKDEPSAETANIGDIVSNAVQGQEFSECPELLDPVCSENSVVETGAVEYKNACHAQTAGEEGWRPGEC